MQFALEPVFPSRELIMSYTNGPLIVRWVCIDGGTQLAIPK